MGGRMIPYENELYDWYEETQDYHLPPASEITVLIGPNAAVAHMQYDGLDAFGDSKRNNGEPFDGEVGGQLAEGRMFIDLGNQIVARAMERLGD